MTYIKHWGTLLTTAVSVGVEHHWQSFSAAWYRSISPSAIFFSFSVPSDSVNTDMTTSPSHSPHLSPTVQCSPPLLVASCITFWWSQLWGQHQRWRWWLTGTEEDGSKHHEHTLPGTIYMYIIYSQTLPPPIKSLTWVWGRRGKVECLRNMGWHIKLMSVLIIQPNISRNKSCKFLKSTEVTNFIAHTHT